MSPMEILAWVFAPGATAALAGASFGLSTADKIFPSGSTSTNDLEGTIKVIVIVGGIIFAIALIVKVAGKVVR